ncbi:MAG: hypothetical protein Q7S13_03670 [Candidatus Omnitrophota bacterium]|nr:hypothetical protein [Candidatus Omnitrophota bacterium]
MEKMHLIVYYSIGMIVLFSPLSFANPQCDGFVKKSKESQGLFEKILNCEVGLGEDEFAAAGDEGLISPVTAEFDLASLPGGDINPSSLSNGTSVVPGPGDGGTPGGNPGGGGLFRTPLFPGPTGTLVGPPPQIVPDPNPSLRTPVLPGPDIGNIALPIPTNSPGPDGFILPGNTGAIDLSITPDSSTP